MVWPLLEYLGGLELAVRGRLLLSSLMWTLSTNTPCTEWDLHRLMVVGSRDLRRELRRELGRELKIELKTELKAEQKKKVHHLLYMISGQHHQLSSSFLIQRLALQSLLGCPHQCISQRAEHLIQSSD